MKNYISHELEIVMFTDGDAFTTSTSTEIETEIMSSKGGSSDS